MVSWRINYDILFRILLQIEVEYTSFLQLFYRRLRKFVKKNTRFSYFSRRYNLNTNNAHIRLLYRENFDFCTIIITIFIIIQFEHVDMIL